MTDQCRSCEFCQHNDLDQCLKCDCSFHESWFGKTILSQNADLQRQLAEAQAAREREESKATSLDEYNKMLHRARDIYTFSLTQMANRYTGAIYGLIRAGQILAVMMRERDGIEIERDEHAGTIHFLDIQLDDMMAQRDEECRLKEQALTWHKIAMSDRERAESSNLELIAQVERLSREVGEMQGKLEGCQFVGVVEGWKQRAETAEAERDQLRQRLDWIEGRPGYPCGCSHEIDADGAVTATHTHCEYHRGVEAERDRAQANAAAMREAITTALDEITYHMPTSKTTEFMLDHDCDFRFITAAATWRLSTIAELDIPGASLLSRHAEEIRKRDTENTYLRQRLEHELNMRYDPTPGIQMMVCATCGNPCETEPCPDHSPVGAKK